MFSSNFGGFWCIECFFSVCFLRFWPVFCGFLGGQKLGRSRPCCCSLGALAEATPEGFDHGLSSSGAQGVRTDRRRRARGRIFGLIHLGLGLRIGGCYGLLGFFSCCFYFMGFFKIYIEFSLGFLSKSKFMLGFSYFC